MVEEIYRNLSSGESVHLEDWPEVDESLVDEELEKQMELARQIVEKGHAARKDAGIKVRQPLAKIAVKGREMNFAITKLIKEELNVKEVGFVEDKGDLEVEFDTTLTPELKAEGEARDLIREIQKLRKKVGCELGDKIAVEAPSWPKEFEEDIKRKTLARELKVGPELKVSK